MERLILFRHGKAEANAPSGRDFDRALTDRGGSDGLLVARALARAGFRPDLAIVSPAVRAQQTWEAAAAAFPGTPAMLLQTLYNAEPDVLLAEAEARGGAHGTVLIVAHNPGLHQLAVTLAQRCNDAPDRSKLNLGLPTGAAAAIDFAASRFALFTPKSLGGDGA
jgi:phosphohistidine phosphatase